MMESWNDSTGLGYAGVEAPFGRDKEIVGILKEEKGQTSALKESARELFLFHNLAEVIPGHSIENLSICLTVLESQPVRKHYGIM